MGWIQDLVNPKARQWEEFYRNRWQHDTVIRSTRGVNCTGGCSWAINVKDGVVVTRANVSARVQSGMCLYYHAVERTIYIPMSQFRGGRRAGGHNSLTRTRINPVELAGGYAPFTYGFNYWGQIGLFTRDTYCVVRKLEKLEW